MGRLMMQRGRCAAAVLAVSAAWGVPAWAITFNGYSTVLPGTSLSQRGDLAGTIIDTRSVQFSTNPNPDIPITFRTWVVRETATGTLDFYYQFSVPTLNPAPPFPAANILPIHISGFDLGPSLDVDYRTDIPGTGGGGGIYAARTAPDLTLGPTNRLGVWQLNSGESTWAMFIHTTATDYTASGTISGTFLNMADGTFPGAFVPVAATPALVPEPAGLALLALAVSGLTLRLGRRAK